MSAIDPMILDRAQEWLGQQYDEQTQNEVAWMIEKDPAELVESFYTDLEFGTGGLRGIMGAGTNRMNRYTVGKTTQGLANYLNKTYPEGGISVAIAHDCRNNSVLFARVTADVMSANGIKVYLFDELRPTPELSFAIRALGCKSGVVVTASHNPKEYNGYKVYWSDGAQLTDPHDVNVISEVRAITDISDVKFAGKPQLIEIIGEEMDSRYIAMVKSLSLSPESIARHHDIPIVYTPIHGTGYKMVPRGLKAFGFTNIHAVPEQDITSGDFPTVHSPNPEEAAALDMAIRLAQDIDAELVMATDPDADRVGIAVKDGKGIYKLLNGNQTASLLTYYLLRRWKELGRLTGSEYIVKTVVTTDLMRAIAEDHGVECFDTLTGFKYIASVIRELEGKRTYIGGGEESYGFMIGEAIRDKDAVSACCIIAEMAAWAADQGMSMLDLLKHIHIEYGLYHEGLLSTTRKGKQGSEEIRAMMERFRYDPPAFVNGSAVVRIIDYKSGEDRWLIDGSVKSTGLPASNVLQFFMEDGSKVTMRPSGTEPKIKFYFGVVDNTAGKEDYEAALEGLEHKIEAIKADLGL
jgi:phosphoglucomutase